MKRPTPDWEKELNEAPVGMGGFTEKSIKRIKERIHLPEPTPRRRQPFVAAAIAVVLLGGAWVLREPIAELFVDKTADVDPVETATRPDPLTLTVQYRQPNDFYNDIGLLYTIRHPEVRFNVPKTNPKKLDAQSYLRWMEETKPDIVEIPLALVDDLAEAGAIAPLDDWIARDGYKLDELYEPVVRTLREAGAGKLYGLAPSFSTQVLYYNKALFDQYGVDLPNNDMTWKETLELAARFHGTGSAGDPLFGLFVQARNRPFDLIASIGASQGLQLNVTASSGATVPTLDSEAWLAVWELAIPAFREKWLAQGNAKLTGSFTTAQMYAADPFLAGNAAMALREGAYSYRMNDALAELKADWEWGAVVAPRERGLPTPSANFTIDAVYAVNASTPLTDAAWSFLRFLTGPERRKSDLQSGRAYSGFTRLPAADYSPADAAIYGGQPDSAAVYAMFEQFGSPGYPEWYNGVIAAGNAMANKVIAGDMTIADAVRKLQADAESLAADAAVLEEDGQ